MKRRQLLHLHELVILVSVAVLFMLFSNTITAQILPSGPDTITGTGKGRHQNNSEPVTVSASAGNVTALVINTVVSTASWQGYYGNVTGTIVLDDASNQTLYDWSLPNPRGEIYASNFSIVAWSNIYCLNVSPIRPAGGTQPGTGNNGIPGGIVYSTNGTGIELRYGINETDRDGLNETFNGTYVDATGFRVGSITIDTVDGCSMAQPYTNQVFTSGWQEVLLSDNTSIIFTSLIRENADAYHSSAEAADFQMLVLENGHPGHELILTSYYFFVELT